jgi:hypothetical protein
MGTIVSGGILDRLDLQRRRLGGNEPLTGRWLRDGDATTLRVFSGQLPIAELIDRNGDGRVDVVLVNRG